MPESRNRAAYQKLLAVAERLKFPPHRIAHLLDGRGRHELELPTGFPFAVSLFHFGAGEITQRLTWHQRLEILVPLDGPLCERMGDRVAELQAGDILVVEHLKPHQVVDKPGLNTRAVVISFLPEFIFTSGSTPTDYAFLIPFHRQVEGKPHVLRAGTPQGDGFHEAMAKLVACYFNENDFHREAGCKAWLLVLLHALIQEFRDSATERVALVRRQEQAARMCGLNRNQFSRVFKQVSGLTLGRYLNQVRMSHAVELLEESLDSIADIALRLGFSDQSHFDRRFRQTFGRTPSRHRSRSVHKL